VAGKVAKWPLRRWAAAREIREPAPWATNTLKTFETLLALKTELQDDEAFQQAAEALAGSALLPDALLLLEPSIRQRIDPALQDTLRETDSHTLQMALESLDWMERVFLEALDGDWDKFGKLLDQLKVGEEQVTHEEVMVGVNAYLDHSLAPSQALAVRRIMAEQNAAEELGLDSETMEEARALLGDDALHIDILQHLQLNHQLNLPWSDVVEAIREQVDRRAPASWPAFDRFLHQFHMSKADDIHDADTLYGHYCEQYLSTPLESPVAPVDAALESFDRMAIQKS